jgi:hypothetical protein
MLRFRIRFHSQSPPLGSYLTEVYEGRSESEGVGKLLVAVPA